MKLLGRIVWGLIAFVVVLYIAVVGYMYFNQRALQYDPTGETINLADTVLTGAREVAIPSGDGVVNSWFAPPQIGKATIIYYKGNAGSFSTEHERFEAWTAAGYGFLAFDYRGFPLSPGTISQEHMLQDSLAAFDWAAGQGAPIMIWGRSIGTGPATYVASQRDARALLLETPFYSAVSVAAERYPILPVYWVMADQFPVNEWIPNVTEPVLVAHGTADTTIGVSNGERVHALAPSKDELWIEPGAGHNDLWARGIWRHADPFFERAMASAQ